MNEPKPLACSLEPDDLRQRLDRIAAIGAASLIDRGSAGGVHTLRFRPGPDTRSRLREIVAAEAECCSFLDLELSEGDGELVLTIAAPRGGEPIADELALAFERAAR